MTELLSAVVALFLAFPWLASKLLALAAPYHRPLPLSVAYSTRAWMMANDAVRVELPERACMVALRHFGLGVESATWRPS